MSLLERVDLKKDSNADSLTVALISLGIRPYSRESVKKYQTLMLMDLKKKIKEEFEAHKSLLSEWGKPEYLESKKKEMTKDEFELHCEFIHFLWVEKNSLERRLPKVQWRRVHYNLEELQKLKVFVPLSVRNMVSDIHKCLPYTDLFVEYLDEMEEEGINWEPFLIAVDDENRKHEEYVKVWDEPQFEGERLA
ncbi:MAG: hypothetical protein AAB944_00910 [Patescibacteria group bacterium]